MALYLLDTNVVSNLRKSRPHPMLMRWMQAVAADQIFISVVTVAEIQCGIGQVRDASVALSVERWLSGMLRDGQPLVVEFDTAAARLLGRMWAAPVLANFIRNDPRSKKAKSGADLAIAASAIACGMVVVTSNVTDFQQIDAAFPLPGLLDPCAPPS
jgi:predicted nucleic acid-binding protein